MNDWDLLNQFVHKRSEDAFARLVELHAAMVYSVCRRRLRDGHLAEDATQAVFIVLAARARTLRAGSLAGWLHQTARHVAERVWRREETRRRHERQAAERQAMTSEPTDLPQEAIEQVDQLLLKLADADRSAIVLRFLEGRSIVQIAEAMHLSEDAAKKRISRGLERLKKLAVSSGLPAVFPTVEAALHAAHSHVAPADIVVKSIAAATGKISAVQTTLFAKEVIHMLILKKLQLISLTVLSILVVTGGTAVVVSKTAQHAAVAGPVPTPLPAAPPATPAAPHPPVNARLMVNRVLPAATFDQVGFNDVIGFLQDVSGIPINVDWNALKEVGVTQNTPASMNFRGAMFGSVLEAMLWSVAEPGKLEYAVRDDHIDISTAAAMSLPKAPDQAAHNAQVIKNLDRNKIPDNQKLRAAMEYMSQLANVPVWVDWVSLKKAGVMPTAQVDTTKLTGMTVPAALNTLLGQAGPKANLRWGYRSGMILVTTESELAKLTALPYVKHDPR